MASLLGFQKEIEQREREARRSGSGSGSGSGKENRQPSGKSISMSGSGTGSGSTPEISGSASAYFKESPIASPVSSKQGSGSLSPGAAREKSGSSDASGQDMPALEDSEDTAEASLQILLLSDEESDKDQARDILSNLLTSHRGEYVLRLGRRPLHPTLFGPDTSFAADDWMGTPRTEEELSKMVGEVERIVEDIGGKTSNLHSCSDPTPRKALLLRLPPPEVSLVAEVRVAVVGNVDSGKSTTLGVLTRGGLDDGRGRARVGLFRHKHELETGRTSSVGMEILGYDASGQPILPAAAASTDQEAIRREKLGWDEITMSASKVISFIDLAGHEKYLKTTLYGLTSGAPSCVMLMVGANAGLVGMSKEHLAIALALNVPVVVCVTKIDMAPEQVLNQTLTHVRKILKSPGCRKTPVFVDSMEKAVELSQVFTAERLCPVFQLSNVTGEGLDLLRAFLNLLPPSDGDGEKYAIDQPLEYSITEIWSVPYVGTVVNGILNSGKVKAGDAIYLGPDANGNWHSTAIKSIQRKRANVNSAEAGQCVSFALKRMKRQAVRKGMIISHKSEPLPKASSRFVGHVMVLYHNTTLQAGYQAMMHCGAIRQTVRMVGIYDKENGELKRDLVLRTADKAYVEFEFVSHPEFIKPGMKLLFREGKTKGLGVITEVHHLVKPGQEVAGQ